MEHKVAELHTTWDYRGVEQGEVVRSTVMTRLADLIKTGGISTPPQSWGSILARPLSRQEFASYFDHPRTWVAVAIGSGPDQERQIMDALRAARATARTGRSTLGLLDYDHDLFADIVPSMTDDAHDPYPWGDCDLAGAVLLEPLDHPCLMSFVSKELDPLWCDWMAREVANAIRTLRLQLDTLEGFR
jgi:hypothetical protein